MKGDFTRFTWDPAKHYSSVRLQQGRVQVDADWNEQADIQESLRETGVADVVGRCGAPRGGGGYRISLAADGADLELSAGRLYVDGILCTAPQGLTYRTQPDLPEAPLPPQLEPPPEPVAGVYLVYLDVWRRHVTALEDPEIRERALGGPDTATRVKTVAQVKLLPADFGGDPPGCAADPAGWAAATAPSSGRLRARSRTGSAPTDPCIVPAQAGYTRLENQLYRVEIHDGGSLGSATFKWSRDNGAVATAWLGQATLAPERLTVASTGNDRLTGFHDARWVELTDDTRELEGRPGVLVRVVRVEGHVIEIDPEGRTIDRADFPRNPKVRRWDLADDAGGALPVEAPVANQGYLELESGIEVRFEAGEYRSGDHWLIPARAFVGEFVGDIEWPLESPGQGAARPPLGIDHHYCKLGLVRFDGQAFAGPMQDCRPRFPALTELVRFYKAGGEGQEALPGRALPCSLRVGVADGEHPLPGARVEFRVSATGGRLETDAGDTGAQVIAVTGADGIAECRWQLPESLPEIDGQGPPCLEARATLLDDTLAAAAPVLGFSACLSQARQVAYDPSACPPLEAAGARTVQRAIDELCRNLDGAEEGIGIVGIRTAVDDRPVEHEATLSVDRLTSGLVIEFEREIAPEAIFGESFQRPVPARPNCTVTLDLPYPLSFDERAFWGDNARGVFGFQPLVLAARLSVQDRFVIWEPASDTADWLERVLFQRLLDPDIDLTDRLLVHLVLRGNYLWLREAGDEARFYVDGNVFGRPGIDGTMALRLPSGDRRRGGDFETWFWITRGAQEGGGLVLTAFANGPVVSGALQNAAGAPVPGVAITLTQALGGQARVAQTTANGSFRFANVPNGRHVASATVGGVTVTRGVVVGGILPLRPVADVPGVGAVFAGRLEAAGIRTAREMADLEVGRLAEILEVPATRAETLREAARQLVR